jgi:hypothetical protein
VLDDPLCLSLHLVLDPVLVSVLDSEQDLSVVRRLKKMDLGSLMVLSNGRVFDAVESEVVVEWI